MKKINWLRFILYHGRWQLSTPILAGVGIFLASMQITNFWISACIANVIGASIFFFVDRIIFQSRKLDAEWEVKDNIECSDCGELCRGYRITKTRNYDRTDESHPEFRCEECSKKKTEKLKQKGIVI